MSKNVHAYVAAITVAAVIAGAGLYIAAPSFGTDYLRAVICFGSVALLAELLRFPMSKGATGAISSTGAISFVPFLASAIVVPHWLTTAIVFIIVAIQQQLYQPYPIRKVFNIAQQSLGFTIAIVAYRVTGGQSLLVNHELAYIPLISLLVSYVIFNSLCVCGVIAISEGKRLMEVWYTALSDAPHDMLTWPIIVCLAWVYARYGVAGTAALSVPLLGLRQLYKVNWQLEQTNQELLELMVAAIEARDPYTSGHSRRVSENAKIIAQILGLRQSVINRVEIAALLHDVGKIHEVFAPILQKPGRLTDEENAIMQTHPIKSEELVTKVSQLKDIVPAVRHHHENWDGTGYPDGIAGERIPLASRIIMFADTIDAMTSDRPYRKALGEDIVRGELVKYRAKQFDPAICDALLSSKRFAELFSHGTHQSLPHTQEVPKLRLAVHS